MAKRLFTLAERRMPAVRVMHTRIRIPMVKGPVEGVNAFQGIGIGKILHGAEAGSGIGACQIYSVRIRKNPSQDSHYK